MKTDLFDAMLSKHVVGVSHNTGEKLTSLTLKFDDGSMLCLGADELRADYRESPEKAKPEGQA